MLKAEDDRSKNPKLTVAGVISDTHGLFREEVKEIFKGCDLIIHAGDVGSEDVLTELAKIGKVIAVRGNVDRRDWARGLPESETVEFAGKWIHVRHIREELDIDPKAAGIDIVVYGHSHRPELETKDGVVYFNPGSAGPRRFHLPITVGLIEIEGDRVAAEVIDLKGYLS